MKKIILIGSTGSIGTQTLDVVRSNPCKFKLVALTANQSADKLIEQAKEFCPQYVVIGNKSYYEYVRAALYDSGMQVMAGQDALNDLVQTVEADIVVSAIVGFAGLMPTIYALKSGKNIALANKETLVVAGDLITQTAQKANSLLLPVDSEHSAIFQCLAGETPDSVEKLILTASGGAFRNHTIEQLQTVTKADALKHPNWNMGAKITIDSATMMNKGLEVIEAHWLFQIPVSNIDVVIHPQSIIHSLVQFSDSSIKAQIGLPDMRLPIHYALNFPTREKANFPRYDFVTINTLTFEKPDLGKFPCLHIAYEAINQGGNMPCIVNAANETAVNAFLKEKIRFMQIPHIIEQTALHCSTVAKPTLDDYLETDLEARFVAEQIINNK